MFQPECSDWMVKAIMSLSSLCDPREMSLITSILTTEHSFRHSHASANTAMLCGNDTFTSKRLVDQFVP